MLEAQAGDAVRVLRERGLTIATAESLTGGLVCAWLTSVPGSSAVVLGGVVAYATSAKELLANAPAQVIAAHGAVAEPTAAAMAAGIRSRLGADLGVATTGVAGPTQQDGHPPGTVYVALAWSGGQVVRSFAGDERLSGDRRAVRAATVRAALEMVSAPGPHLVS